MCQCTAGILRTLNFYHFGIALATYSYFSSVAYLESLNLCYLPFLKQLCFYKPGAFIHLCTTLEDHSSFIYPIAVDSLAIPFQGPDFFNSLKNETSIAFFSCKLKAVLSS